MAYTDDAVLAKLSGLNESHDSIATAAQWIMFHRRHADRTVQLWLQRLKDSPSSKRLNLIYLANEVTQQSKVRHKDDFHLAFSPVIADATAIAYRSSSSDVQNKIRRVVDVWRDRGIFDTHFQNAIESRLNEVDKEKGTSAAGSLVFGAPAQTASVPPELNELVVPQQTVSKLLLTTKASVATALRDYDTHMGSVDTMPSAPVYAARLNGLLKSLASAEGAVRECVKARSDLIGSLEKLLDANRKALAEEQKHLETLSVNKTRVDDKKQEVELAIMSGLNATEHNQSGGNGSMSPSAEPDRPEIEALTPPSYEEPEANGTAGVEAEGLGISSAMEPVHQPSVAPAQPSFQPSGIELLSNIASQYSAVPVTINGANKRRRLDADDEFPDLGKDDGIEADVVESLNSESRSL